MVMAVEHDWLEYARLGVSALTPVMTGLVGMLIVRVGHRMSRNQQLHGELMRKRLTLFEDIAPKLNDIFCFYHAVGHWAELSPEEVIKRKRAIDRVIQVNRYLFRSEFWQAYKTFEEAHFEMFSAPGQPARLRLDMEHVTLRAGKMFNPEWLPSVSMKTGKHEEQYRHYDNLMEILGQEVRGAL
jgi:hypothetical protein